MNVILFLLVGALAAFFTGATSLFNEYGELNIVGLVLTTLAFFAGGLLSTVVRFVPPKTEIIITFLGTKPIQQLKTGIALTLPWPFGWTHDVISTEVRASKIKVQIKSKDNIVFNLPVTIQHVVENAMSYAIERENPDSQMENLAIASIRATGNGMEFQAIYDDKDKIRDGVVTHIAPSLATFGMKIVELVVEDPELHDSTATALNKIREAEYDRQAAVHTAEAMYIKMVGEARAEAESTRLKGIALSGFRMQIAEGNAAAIAVMQGKLAVQWVDQEIGEGANKQTVKVAKFIDPKVAQQEAGGIAIPEVTIDPNVILDFFKVVDSNDAIRDAANKPGTVIVAPAGGSSSNLAEISAMIRALPKAA